MFVGARSLWESPDWPPCEVPRGGSGVDRTGTEPDGPGRVVRLCHVASLCLRCHLTLSPRCGI